MGRAVSEADVVIVGGGPAGLAAALAARRAGVQRLLILERDSFLGGILNQCIHGGFGLRTFREELTGPEYAKRYIDRIAKEKILYRLNTAVIEIRRSPETGDPHAACFKEVVSVGAGEGLTVTRTRAVILAMGCRERPRGALNIPGFRPAGVYTAGTAQRLMNIEGRSVGKRVVILGSGDIGLIMARRMTLEGAKVLAVAELMPYPGGLKRNLVQCLDDYGIPLKLNHTVVDIEGRDRVTGVVLAEVGPDRKPIPGTKERLACDTLLLSVGLIPENELTRSLGAEMDRTTSGAVVNDRLETGVSGVFACGNVLHVHDLADNVSEEAASAGESAAEYVRRFGDGSAQKTAGEIRIAASGGVRYTVPQRVDPGRMRGSVPIRFRVDRVYRGSCVCVYYDERLAARIPKRIMTPGGMEQVILRRESFDGGEVPSVIRICTEEV